MKVLLFSILFVVVWKIYGQNNNEDCCCLGGGVTNSLNIWVVDTAEEITYCEPDNNYAKKIWACYE